MKYTLFFFLVFASLTMNAQKLPNVTLKDLDGKNVNVSSYNNSDKPVIISFWATWCGPCLKELKAIKEVYPQWQKETGVKLVAVSVDDAKTIKRVKPLVNGNSWTYEVLLDQNQALKRALNVVNVPYTIIVHKGEIVYSHSSYSPGIENEIYKQLKKLSK
ncbi:TlpA family protein disulfide reductase [Paenimyroides ceti]